METVRDARLRKGFTQKALAERCGCDETTISHLENDRELPSLTLFARLARELKLPPTKLLRLFKLTYKGRASGDGSKRANSHQ